MLKDDVVSRLNFNQVEYVDDRQSESLFEVIRSQKRSAELFRHAVERPCAFPCRLSCSLSSFTLNNYLNHLQTAIYKFEMIASRQVKML